MLARNKRSSTKYAEEQECLRERRNQVNQGIEELKGLEVKQCNIVTVSSEKTDEGVSQVATGDTGAGRLELGLVLGQKARELLRMGDHDVINDDNKRIIMMYGKLDFGKACLDSSTLSARQWLPSFWCCCGGTYLADPCRTINPPPPLLSNHPDC